MSRFPGRKGKKGKGPNRHNRQKNEHETGSPFENNDHGDTFEGRAGDNTQFRSDSRRHRDDASGSNQGETGRRNASGVSGDGGTSGVSSRAPTSDIGPVHGNRQQDADAPGVGSPEEKHVPGRGGKARKRRGKRRGNGALDTNTQFMRNVRPPVSPVPEVAYTPKPPARATAKHKRVNRNRQGHDGKSLYAALDLGTNNCRLLVAMPQERGRFRVVDGFSRIVRLGEGLAGSGRLSDEAMERAIGALKICSEKMMSHNIRRHRLIATEACRQALNGKDFLARVRAETGMNLEIIDRETEAYLAAEGCGALMDRKADAAVLFDIGGGSSELVLVNREGKRKRVSEQIVSWTSVPIGVVTLAERHGGKVVDRNVFESMINEVRNHLETFEGRDRLARIWENGRVHLLGTSGTVTTLAGVHLGLPKYERRLVDGLWLTDTQIDTVIGDLLEMDYDQRARSPCIGRERADLVMAGCAILEAIRRTWPANRLRVADRGLREGILTQMMDRDAAWLPPKRGRWRRPYHHRNHRKGGGNHTGNTGGNP